MDLCKVHILACGTAEAGTRLYEMPSLIPEPGLPCAQFHLGGRRRHFFLSIMPTTREDLSAKRARQLINYDPEDGSFTWNQGRGGMKPGEKASYIFESKPDQPGGGNTYRRIAIDGTSYMAHRLAFLVQTGEWPNEIDHIDGDGLNNKWSNLREVSRSGNCKNRKRRTDNTSGYTGISWHKVTEKWQAGISVNGERKYLGLYENLDDAVEARKRAERECGFHPNHDRHD